jgi:hypothetical protein
LESSTASSFYLATKSRNKESTQRREDAKEVKGDFEISERWGDSQDKIMIISISHLESPYPPFFALRLGVIFSPQSTIYG